MKRLSAIKLMVSGLAVPFIPLPQPRCDAAMFEARVAAGESIAGETFIFRRTARVTIYRYDQLRNCHFIGKGPEEAGPVIIMSPENPVSL